MHFLYSQLGSIEHVLLKVYHQIVGHRYNCVLIEIHKAFYTEVFQIFYLH